MQTDTVRFLDYWLGVPVCALLTVVRRLLPSLRRTPERIVFLKFIEQGATVLAQDDSAVGVKNGINAFGQKNYLGTFTPPFAVVNDSSFLATLSDRDWCGGLSEAVKAALIKDHTFFEDIEERAAALAARDMTAMEHVVRRSAALHLQHIATAGDPFEMGSSRPLDFGHWAAHKLERLTSHQLRHGEAVAIGIALDSTYSHLSGFLAEGDWRRILALLSRLEIGRASCRERVL